MNVTEDGLFCSLYWSESSKLDLLKCASGGFPLIWPILGWFTFVYSHKLNRMRNFVTDTSDEVEQINY